MVGATKIRIDENDANNFTKVKKLGVQAANENTKRAALGDLQNRAVLRLANAKEAAQKDLSLDAKLKNAIQKTKPRVDTHWKKAPGAATASNKPNTAAAEQPKKIATRSNSLRRNNIVNGSSALQQRNAVAGLNKPKTFTTKVVESKLPQAKVKAAQEEKVNNAAASTTGEHLTLRREESNISLKSLNKLKAALTRDGSKVTVGKPLVQSTKAQLKSSSVEKEDANTEANKNNDFKIINVKTCSPEVFGAIEDIDAGDSDQLLLVSEYVNEIYNYLFQLEEEQYVRENHLDDQLEVSPKMRAVLIDWINEVHFQFHLTPETFQMSVAIIDRYLQKVKVTKRTNLQLVGVTALFIAAKYEELVPPSIAEFVYITDDTYTSRQIVQMELRIFKTLDCNLSRPLPIQFLRRFSKAAKVEDIHHAMAKYFLELSSIEYELASYKPSEIAAASLFLALHLLKENSKLPTGFNDKHWTPTMQWYSHYAADHLRPIARKIATVVRHANTAKLKAVYTKYQSSKLYKISMRPELYDKLIDSIINHNE